MKVREMTTVSGFNVPYTKAVTTMQQMLDVGHEEVHAWECRCWKGYLIIYVVLGINSDRSQLRKPHFARFVLADFF